MQTTPSVLSPNPVQEGVNQQDSAAPQDITPNHTEASVGATVTLQRNTLRAMIISSTVIILILLGAVLITTSKLMDMEDLLNQGMVTDIISPLALTEAQKDLPILSRKEGVIPNEVWHWIKTEKAEVIFNPKSAHALLTVSSDGKSLYQTSPGSPPRVPIAATYLKCICVSSYDLPSTRVYFDLQATKKVRWTLGFRTASFDADNNFDFIPDSGIWTIATTDGKIVINDGKAIQTPYPTPALLLLYLDYKRGQLSFYDAVSKFHLHTYIGTFNETLQFYAAVEVGIEEIHDALITFT